MTAPAVYRRARANHCPTCDVEWVSDDLCWNCGGPGTYLLTSTSVPWADGCGPMPDITREEPR